MSQSKICQKCPNWENCPIRQGEYCVPVRKVKREKKHESNRKNKRD